MADRGEASVAASPQQHQVDFRLGVVIFQDQGFISANVPAFLRVKLHFYLSGLHNLKSLIVNNSKFKKLEQVLDGSENG